MTILGNNNDSNTMIIPLGVFEIEEMTTMTNSSNALFELIYWRIDAFPTIVITLFHMISQIHQFE